MGTGTTAIACKNLRMNFVGTEKDFECFNASKDRIEKL